MALLALSFPFRSNTVNLPNRFPVKSIAVVLFLQPQCVICPLLSYLHLTTLVLPQLH